MTYIVERLRALAREYPTRPHYTDAADEIERLNTARLADSQRMVRMSDEFERLTAAHDDYMVRANANVCELNREIERLRTENEILVKDSNARVEQLVKQDYEIERLRAENERLFREIAVQANYLTAEIERLRAENETLRQWRDSHLTPLHREVARLRDEIEAMKEAEMVAQRFRA
jgi:chromosome segregation ATPase